MNHENLPRTRRLLFIACAIGAPLVALVRVVGGCSTSSNEPEFGCGDDAAVIIVPYAAPGVPVVLADGGVVPATGLTITGSVIGAPCGVQSVSVLSAVQAAPDLQNFASWSAVVPLALLESTAPCDAGSGGSGVWVTAQASIISDPGTVNPVVGTLDGGVCVSLTQPMPPRVCSMPTVMCPLEAGVPSPYWGPAGVQCQLPLAGGPPATFEVFTSEEGVNRQLSWKSTDGLTTLTSSSPLVVNSPAQTACGEDAGCDCKGASTVTAVGATAASAGVDYVTATIDGYPTPVASITVSVQGPVKIGASATSLTNGTAVFLTVPNPMGFAESCSIAIPVGIQVVASLDGGTFPTSDAGTCSPAFEDASATQETCLTQDSFQGLTRVYAVSFLTNLTDATARAAGLSNARLLSINCTDQFSQTGSSMLSVVWSFAPDAGTATSASDGGAEGGSDGGLDASTDASDASTH